MTSLNCQTRAASDVMNVLSQEEIEGLQGHATMSLPKLTMSVLQERPAEWLAGIEHFERRQPVGWQWTVEARMDCFDPDVSEFLSCLVMRPTAVQDASSSMQAYEAWVNFVRKQVNLAKTEAQHNPQELAALYTLEVGAFQYNALEPLSSQLLTYSMKLFRFLSKTGADRMMEEEGATMGEDPKPLDQRPTTQALHRVALGLLPETLRTFWRRAHDLGFGPHMTLNAELRKPMTMIKYLLDQAANIDRLGFMGSPMASSASPQFLAPPRRNHRIVVRGPAQRHNPSRKRLIEQLSPPIEVSILRLIDRLNPPITTSRAPDDGRVYCTKCKRFVRHSTGEHQTKQRRYHRRNPTQRQKIATFCYKCRSTYHTTEFCSKRVHLVSSSADVQVSVALVTNRPQQPRLRVSNSSSAASVTSWTSSSAARPGRRSAAAAGTPTTPDTLYTWDAIGSPSTMSELSVIPEEPRRRKGRANRSTNK